MNTFYLAGGLVGLALLVYLLVAMFKAADL